MSAFITSIGTALPPYKSSQRDLLSFMKNYLSTDKKKSRELEVLYRASGIQFRYSVLNDFNEQNNSGLFADRISGNGPDLDTRLSIYKKEAIKLATQAVQNCLAGSAIDKKDVTHLLTVSCTGMDAPGIDIQLIEQLHLATHVERTAINFMGCYGCFNALKIANHILGHQPGARVLIVSVELCSLHLQFQTNRDNLLSNSLFGDGAAAVLLESIPRKKSLKIIAFHNDMALKASQEMKWEIGRHGFLMTLSSGIPDLIKQEINAFTQTLLEKAHLSKDHIKVLATHPGGKSILKAVEDALGFTAKQNQAAHEVLQSYGNMSSATILFVLRNCMEAASPENHDQHILSFAFGPGLTMESGIFTFHFL